MSPHPSFDHIALSSQPHQILHPIPWPKKPNPKTYIQSLFQNDSVFNKPDITPTTDQIFTDLNTMYCSFSLSFPLLLLLIMSISFLSTHCVSTNQQSTNMDPHELETLFKIMETVSSDQNWRILHPYPCKPGSSWLGIECKNGVDNKSHVTRLDFGTHPNPTCKPTATFPNLIFQLPNLESVFFIQCFTHSRTRIYVSRNRLLSSSLQQLSLRSNPALIGSIPSQLSSLKSLQVLTLSQNSLLGEIPVDIFSMSFLVHLDLSYNKLTGKVPDQIGNLQNLVGLDLSYNKFIGPIPDTIGQLSMLQKLDLSSNAITGSIPESTENLPSLSFMALSNNKLRGKFPKGISKLQSLQYFLMDDNPMFIPLPVEFGQLKKLQELRLDGSGYSGTIPSSYSQLLNLTTLSLQNNKLTGEIPVGFSSLSHIYHLNLSRNFLGGVVPFNSSFLKRLGRNLDLSGNPGLCLSPSEAHAVFIGVGVCGSNSTNNSITMPFKKSEAPSRHNRSFFLVAALGIVAFHYLVSLV